jgi:hypothetical protein
MCSFRHPYRHQQLNNPQHTNDLLVTFINTATMKIINTSGQTRTLPDYDRILDDDIQELQRQVGVKTPINASLLPTEAKYRYMGSLTRFYLDLASVRCLQEDIEQEIKHRSASFTCFLALPVELQDQIWEHAIAPDLKPRVHCVMERNSKIISNQPISPLLHACAKSRNLYLSRTCAVPAFRTYVDFEIDIISLFQPYDKSPGDASMFLRFLESSSAESTQKLAMQKELYCNIPLEGHMSETHLEMRYCMQDWDEAIVVFGDNRSTEEVWSDIDMKFRDLSAREKRKTAAVSYARQHARALGRMMGPELDAMPHRFVVIADRDAEE